VYITDHKHKTKKYHTTTEEEDEHFFNYMLALQEYKKVATPARVS
jgi:hypothetical protein